MVGKVFKNPVKSPMPKQISLREVKESDLPIFFEHQRDVVANQMAAFPARDRGTFMAHWEKIMGDKNVILKLGK
jgi:hypothetical protein